jgi:AraC-like DNA-binding protein
MQILLKDDKYFMEDSISVNILKKPVRKIFPEHKHDFFEIVYILKGKSVQFIDGKEYHVRHGDVLIINYNQTHSAINSEDFSYVNILMKPEYINNSLARSENAFALLHLSEFESFRKILDESKCKISFSGEERNRIEEIISILSEEMEQKSPGYELAVRSQLNLLLIMIFRKMSLKLENIFDGVSEELLMYIREHCSEKLSLKSIAELCAYNMSYFSRIFKERVGMTFTEYLKRVRLEKAAIMMETTTSNITDIAYSVGYTDKTKFFSDFKQLKGVSPLKFRKSKN